MADELRIKIGADVVEFTKSIAEVEAELKQLGESAKTLSGQSLKDVNNQIGTLSEALKRLKSVGKEGFDEFGVAIKKAGDSTTKTGDAAGKASITLGNLSRIASDAPFGFIAIQNNLDPLLQSFGSLSKTSGGAGAALKALAGSLVGPAGLAVGFSVVSALVTTAIQKYGSLGNALSELAASSDIASINQRKLSAVISESSASSQGEINTLNNYIGILKDVTAPQQDRINAYNILKKEFPAVIQNLSVENALTAQGGQIIAQRSQQLIKYIKLKGQEKALIALIEKEYETQYKTLQGLTNTLQDGDSFLNQFINSALGGGIAVVGLSRRVTTYTGDIQKAAKSTEFFETTLKGIQQEIASTDPNIIDPQAAIKSAQDAAKAAEQAAKKLSAGKLKEAKKAQKEELKFNIETQKLITAYIEGESKLRQNELNNIAKENADFEKQQLQDLQNDVAMGGQTILNSVNDSFKALSTTIENTALKGQAIATLFSQAFNPIVDQFFTNIEEGQNVFKGLGDVVKQFVKNAIVQLVKLAAFAAITSLFSGGAVSFGKAFTGGLGGAFGLPKMGGVAAGGVNVNVAGQFALRGTDLVASVASSQQSIKRVG